MQNNKLVIVIAILLDFIFFIIGFYFYFIIFLFSGYRLGVKKPLTDCVHVYDTFNFSARSSWRILAPS